MNESVEFQQLKLESERLRVDFLFVELELSYTLATFAAEQRIGTPLRDSCYNTAQKGYVVVLRLLAKHGAGTSPAKVLQNKLDRLRLALADLDSIDSAQPSCTSVTREVHADSVLTNRELDVLKGIAEGYSTKQVAGLLGITFKTAACHRYRVMEKLDLHDTASLVRYAIRIGLTQA
jgi:DNA-binding CsgD family transcriptional regulator